MLVFAAGCLAAAAPSRSEEAKRETREVPVMLFPIVKDGKWGYMNQTGTVMIQPQYDCAGDFSEGLACVQMGLWRGYIDRTGKMVIQPQFGWAGKFSNRLAPAHTKAQPWGDSLSFHGKPKAWTFINTNGVKVFEGWDERPPDFREGKMSVGKACFGTNGKPIPHSFDRVGPFSEGMAAALKEGQWGYADDAMKIVLEPQYEEADMFSEGLAPVAVSPTPVTPELRKNPKWRKSRALKWGYIEKSGRLVITPRFEDAWPFSEGLAAVRIGGKWGYVDKTGVEVIAPKYDYVWRFSEGLGRVMMEGKHGYVDRKGLAAIPPKFDTAWEFSNGLARVGLEGKEGYINPKGEYVWEPSK